MNKIAPVSAYLCVCVSRHLRILDMYLQYKLGTCNCTCTWGSVYLIHQWNLWIFLKGSINPRPEPLITSMHVHKNQTLCLRLNSFCHFHDDKLLKNRNSLVHLYVAWSWICLTVTQ